MSKIKIKNIRVKNSIGFKNDKIFLLSAYEYEKYKNVIPKCNTCWWLRTPGSYSYFASYVYDYGFVNSVGGYAYSHYYGVRPALKSKIFQKVGETLVVNNFPFTCINKGLGIATVPISFDKFDKESNDYETSYVRKCLLIWYNKNN